MKPHATRTSLDYTNNFVKFKQEMTKTPAPEVREWKDYKPSREMEAASARAAEIHKIPSLVR